MATFGKTTQGGSESQAGGNLVRGSKFTLSERASITSMTLNSRVSSGTTNFKMGIYSDNGSNTPSTLQGVTNTGTITNTSLADNTLTFASPLILTAGTYWLTYNNDAGTSANGLFYSSSTLSNGEDLDNETYPSFNSTYSDDGRVNNEVTIYATYTPAPLNPENSYSFFM